MKLLIIVIGLFLIVRFGYSQPEFDYIAGQTIHFKDRTKVKTNLCDLKFIGQIIVDSSRYLIISGRAGTGPEPKISVFIQRPEKDRITISSKSSFYSYPSNYYNKDSSLFSDSRAFYGEILSGRYGIIWFHKIYLSQTKCRYSVFLAEIKCGKIVESNSNELISKTLEQVKNNKAFEFKALTE